VLVSYLLYFSAPPKRRALSELRCVNIPQVHSFHSHNCEGPRSNFWLLSSEVQAGAAESAELSERRHVTTSSHLPTSFNLELRPVPGRAGLTRLLLATCSHIHPLLWSQNFPGRVEVNKNCRTLKKNSMTQISSWPHFRFWQRRLWKLWVSWLFNDAVSIETLLLRMIQWLMNDEFKMIRKERSRSIWNNIPAFAWRYWEKPRKTSVRIAGAGIPADIRTKNLSIASLEPYPYNNLFGWRLLFSSKWNRVVW
jgi:hypothetical protein